MWYLYVRHRLVWCTWYLRTCTRIKQNQVAARRQRKYFNHFHAKLHPPPSERGYPHDRRRPSLHVITRPRTSTVQTPTFRNEFIRSSQSIEPTFVLAAVRADIHIPAIGITAPRRCPPLDHQLLRSLRFLPAPVFQTIPIDGHVFRPPFHLPTV